MNCPEHTYRHGMARRNSPRDSADVRLIGCCGAYCKTCRSFVQGSCGGCKVGYEEGRRHISRARCRIKKCCLGVKGFGTCAECPGSGTCEVLGAFHAKRWPEYAKYKESLEFMERCGYSAFIERARGWTRSYGELDARPRKKS